MSDFKIERKNPPQNFFNDLYHYLIRMRWPLFVGFVLCLFLSLNGLFALLYYLQPDSLGLETEFKTAFFFSVQTFSTVGYGHLNPQTDYADIVAAIEIFVGMVYMALTTGLFFSKFSLPKSKILFPDKILITKMNGEDALIFRIANARNNRIMDAEIALHFLYDEVTQEGVPLRRFEELPLVKNKTPLFSLSLLGIHSIAGGALAGIREQEVLAKRIEFIISVKGVDETYGQSIHATKLYGPEEIHWGGKYADILSMDDPKHRKIDFSKFNQIIDL